VSRAELATGERGRRWEVNCDEERRVQRVITALCKKCLCGSFISEQAQKRIMGDRTKKGLCGIKYLMTYAVWSELQNQQKMPR